jgi:leucyl-tRNA synthetase
MQGYNVLHPMGWDAFGLPAEQFAIKTKTHPRVAVDKNTKRYKEQLSVIGFNYDWDREINTTDPEFYKWTQWTFLQMFKKGLAYESHEPINWCPSCQTGLANEDLEGNACERCGTIVEKRPIRQWVLRITDYADRLLNDLEDLNWPASIKESQRNWIGRSEGAEIQFKVESRKSKAKKVFTVFTTRPDTLFGVTYCVLAPEHELISELKSEIENNEEVRAYIEQAKKKEDIERTAEGKEKTGVKLEGVWAINPATGEKIPMFVADYVLGHYGTGAVMAVPAHDERDFAFAKKFNLPIKEVVEPLVTREMGEDAFVHGEAISERKAVVAVIQHWKEDTYLAVEWKKTGWKGFIIGGIENGEDAKMAGIREIAEETGYKDVEFVKNLGGTIHARFFQKVKNQNRVAHFAPALFKLKSGERSEISEEEKALHEFAWLTREEMEKFITHEDMRVAWRRVTGKECFTGNRELIAGCRTSGVLVNSGDMNGLEISEAKEKITEKFGKKVVRYKLRDWVFSRQRYWGEPIPLIHCEKCGVVPVPEKDLPVRLPEVEHYEPTGTGQSPLANISEWVNVKCPQCGGAGKRETNTMPQWAGSSWYYLRYIDPHNDTALVDKAKEKYWSPVDMYVGGAEHATRHLIYARFWHKFLYDIGTVNYQEPFTRLQHVGLIMAEDGRKMSKRYGNVINPDEIVMTYGADTLRLYEMFMGPFDQAVAWSTKSIIGARRFIERVWKFQELVSDETSTKEVETALHRTIKKVEEDIEQFSFNTAIAAMMGLANEIEKAKHISKQDYEALVRILAPFTPHVAEELWHEMGNNESIYRASWPAFDASKIAADTMRIAVQVDGKVRGQFDVSATTEEEAVKAEALLVPEVKKWIEGKDITKFIYVKGRLVSIVTKAGT